jgi:hypothetical protein
MAAESHAKSSYLLTSSTLVYTGSCALWRVKIITDGTNAATVIIYDNTSAEGNVLDQTTVPGASYYGGGNWIRPVGAAIGLYAAISGTGAKCIVEYDS